MSLFHVLVFAFLFGARASTGVVLPLLLVARCRRGPHLSPARALGLRAPHAFVGTSAWFFFIINLFKVPFSVALGLIRGPTLLLNLVLAPAVLAGVLTGRWLLERIPQRVFEHMLLAFAVLAALRLIGAF